MRDRLPRPTIRLRLTALYGGLFLVSGAALLAITYLLVVHGTVGFVFAGQGGSGGVEVVQQAPASAGARKTEPTDTHRGGDPRGPRVSPARAAAQASALESQARRQHASELHQLLRQSAIALAGMAVVSIALGWVVAGRVLRPLRTITATARDISAANLQARLALHGPDDEIKELGDTFDALLARLDAAFVAQRRFIANASHELRTPLARQRAVVQVALADPDATAASLRAAHTRVLASEEQLERLIDALLTLSRGQAGLDRRERFDLAAVAGQVLAGHRTDAAERGVELHAQLASATAGGDVRLVERLVANLLDNALRYNEPGGHATVTTGAQGGHAVLSVANTGPVVPESARAELFQPFRRLGAERTRRGDGLGLGLSIVQAIADAHEATLTVRPRPGGGLEVRLRFPAEDPQINRT